MFTTATCFRLNMNPIGMLTTNNGNLIFMIAILQD